VLIVKTSSMGDVVHALPAVSDLARHRPGVRIDWLVEEAFAEIPRLHGKVERVIPMAWRRWRQQLRRPSTWQQLAALRRELGSAGYRLVLDCQGLVKSAWVARWARAPIAGPGPGSARERMASWFYERPIVVDRSSHAIDRNRLLAARAFGYAIDGPVDFGLRLSALAPGALAPWIPNRRFALLLTNASRTSKLWSDDRWIDLEAWLAEQGLCSVLVWGSESERVASMRRAARMRMAQVAPAAGLQVLAAISARATLVVGLDTGLTHWAAAVGAPTIGIFCAFDPDLIGLKGDERRVNLGGIGDPPSAEDVIDAARQVLSAVGHRAG